MFYSQNKMPSHPAGTIENGQYRSFNQMQANHLMPSYIQILFAPRKPIAFLKPINKPFKYQFAPFHDGKTDYALIKKKLEQKKEEKQRDPQFQAESLKKQEIYMKKKGVCWKDKEKRWKDQMKTHVEKKQNDYTEWVKGLQNPDFENVTSDAYKTLIVYNLVKFISRTRPTKKPSRKSSKSTETSRPSKLYATWRGNREDTDSSSSCTNATSSRGTSKVATSSSMTDASWSMPKWRERTSTSGQCV